MRGRDVVLAFAVFLVALALRLAPLIMHPFDGLYGQDAYAYYAMGESLAGGQPYGGIFVWGVGYPAALAAGFLLGGVSPGMAQAITLLLGAALAPLVYALARLAGVSRIGAAAAGLLMAVCGQAIQSSIVVMSDVLALACATASAVMLVASCRAIGSGSLRQGAKRLGSANAPRPPVQPIGERDKSDRSTYEAPPFGGESGKFGKETSPRANEGHLPFSPGEGRAGGTIYRLRSFDPGRDGFLAASAVLLTFAVITRWNYAVLAPVWAGVWWLGSGRERLRDEGIGAVVMAAVAVAAAALAFLPQALFALARPSPQLYPYGAWNLANAMMSHFTTLDGTQQFAEVNALFNAHPLYDPYWLHGIFGALALIGVVALAQRNRPAGLLFGGWFAVGYLFLCGIPYQNPRFDLLYVPPILVCAGAGSTLVWERRSLLLRIGLAAASLYGGTLMVQSAGSRIATFIAWQDSDKIIARAVVARLPADATLYTFEMTQEIRVYARFSVRELYYETPESVAADHGDPGKLYLLIDLNKLRSQWAGMPVEVTFDALVRAHAMRRIDQLGAYSLFLATR